MDNILITQIGEDGDNNAFFPSPGGGKICAGKDGRTFVVYANASGTTITMSYDGHTWNKGQILPLSRPYMVVDSGGFIHIAGLGEEGVWYFQSREPNSVDHFSDGERIYPPNYSALAIGADDTLYYFGSRLAGGAFLKKPRGGTWSHPYTVVNGGIYPGVACHGSSVHVIYCGWNHIPALYEGVYYMKSEDGGETWQKSDGTPLKLPVQHGSNQEELVSLTQNTGGGESNTHDLCIMVDCEGKPHILYWYSRPYFIAFGTASGSSPEPNIRVKHVRRDNDGWKYNHLCDEPYRDVAYAVMTQDKNRRIYSVVTHKHVSDMFYDIGYLFSDDNGDNWSEIYSVTKDANERRLSYAHPAINRNTDSKLQFVFNMWTGKKLSPIYYAEMDI